MKKINIIIVVIIVLVVVAIVLVSSNRYSTLENNESSFAIKDTATITKVFIADKNDNEVLLSKTEKGWMLNNKYFANTTIINQLLGTIKQLKVKSPVSLAKHDNVIRRMAATSVKVEVYQMVYRINLFDKIRLFKREKLTKVFYVGDATQNNLGTHMLMEGAERPYVVFVPSLRGYLSTRFSPMPDAWKSHVVFNNKLADIKTVQLEFVRKPENSFRVDMIDGRGNYEITELQTGESISSYDTLRLLNFLTSFRDLRYETRLNNIKSTVAIDSIIHSPALYELHLIDNYQDTTYVKMFEKREVSREDAAIDFMFVSIDYDRFYGLINDGEDFVLMQYYTFDKVLKPLSYYEK